MTAVFFLAIIVALISFLPNTSVIKVTTEDASYNDNFCKDRILIFFEEISKYKNPSVYLRDIYKCYLDTNVRIRNLNKIELDYANEILINSIITSYK